MNVGANRLSALNFQQQLQQQEQQRQQQYLQLRLQQEQDQGAQRDFRNSLDLAQYNRQSDRDQALGQYQQGSLGLRQGGLDLRRQALGQRLTELKQKIDAGIASREDTQEFQQKLAEYNQGQITQRSDTAESGRQNRFDTTMDWKGQHEQAINKRTQDRMDWDQRKFQSSQGLKMTEDEYNFRWKKATEEMSVLIHQAANLSNEAKANQYFPDRMQPIQDAIQKNHAAQDDLKRQFGEIEQLHRQALGNQGAPTTQPASPDEFGPGGGGGWPRGVQSSESGYYVGQVIQTPKGAVVVTGVDNPDDPTVRPM